MSGLDMGIPPRPRRPTVQVEHTPEGLSLSRRNRDWGVGSFLLLWLIGWTVGCVFLAGMVLNDPTLFHLAFAIPFWAAWLFVAFMVLKSFCQRDRLIVSVDGVRFDRRILLPVQERFVPLDEVQEFESYSHVADSESGRLEWGIQMVTTGQPVRLFQGIPEQERLWLQQTLNDVLGQVSGRRVIPQSAGPADDVPAGEVPADEDSFEEARLTVAAQPVRPPADCSWERIECVDSVVFQQRGKLSWAALFGLLFINAFWNGIVSVFVLVLFGLGGDQPAGAEWWGMFFFLIPFEVIGLCMAVALLFTLVEPFRRTSWHFHDHLIERRTKWLGLGPVRRHEFEHIERIELHGNEQAGWRKFPVSKLAQRTAPNQAAAFSLMFVDCYNAEICSVGGLTEGEARWMADATLREQPGWSR
jgi:hypothetical protein